MNVNFPISMLGTIYSEPEGTTSQHHLTSGKETFINKRILITGEDIGLITELLRCKAVKSENIIYAKNGKEAFDHLQSML